MDSQLAVLWNEIALSAVEALFLAMRHASERVQHEDDYNTILHSPKTCHFLNHCLKTVLRHIIAQDYC